MNERAASRRVIYRGLKIDLALQSCSSLTARMPSARWLCTAARSLWCRWSTSNMCA